MRLSHLPAMLVLAAGAFAAPSMAATETVTWTSLVAAATGAGGAVSRVPSGSSWYSAAIGTRALTGDGRFEFKASHTGLNPWVNAMAACLNSGTLDVQNGASLEHCIVVGAGVASVYVQGRWMADTGMTTSDLVGLGVEGGVVRFYRNGVAFYSSSLAPAFPAVPFWSTNHDGYGLTSATVTSSAASAPAPAPAPAPASGTVVWSSLISAAAPGNGAIRKVAGSSWYGAGLSSQTLNADGRFEFSVNNTGQSPSVNAMHVCLNSGSYDIYVPSSFEHCLVVGAGYASAYVAGRWSSDIAIATSDRLALGIEGGSVRFYKNGTPFFTSGLRPVLPVNAFWSTAFDGFGLTSASVVGGSSGTAPPPAPAPVANRPPVISGAGSRTVRVGETYDFVPTASDPDGNPLQFSVSGNPAWLTFDRATGRLRGAPASGNIGSFPMSLSVSDGSLSAALALTVTVVAGNRAPTIASAAPASVMVGQAYAFTPSASDPDGDRLTFSASGLPSWAAFDAQTGRISGTPSAAQVGSSTVVIRVSDGTLSASTQLTVTVVATTSGRATLSWTPPLTRTDGSTLTNLASYRIYYGTSSGSLANQIVVSNPSLSTWLVENLTPGTWYFAMSAVDANALESSRTGVVSLAVR